LHARQLAAPGEEGEVIAHLSSDEAFEGYWRRLEVDAKAFLVDHVLAASAEIPPRPITEFPSETT